MGCVVVVLDAGSYDLYEAELGTLIVGGSWRYNFVGELRLSSTVALDNEMLVLDIDS